MTVIGTNVSALRAANASSSASMSLATTMERLSTGKRINSAKDDAAGLAIASRMTSAVKSMAVAIRNANDGISMAQTAEGALGEVTNMLQRMKELATQSANGTLGTSERAALQAESDQLTSQINDIARTTNFNGLSLLDGSLASLNLQTGIKSGDTVAIGLAAVSSDKLGLSTGGGTVVSGRVAGGVNLTSALTVNGVTAIASGAQVADAKALAVAINAVSDRTDVTATASNSYTTAALTGPFASGTINGIAVAAATDSADLVTKINADSAKFGVTATLNSDSSITLNNVSGDDIVTTGGAFGSQTQEGFVALNSKDGSKFIVAGGASGNLGLNAYSGVDYTGTAVTGAASTDLSAVKINGFAIGVVADAAGTPTATTTGAVIAAAINALTAKTGVVATSNAGVLTLASSNGGPVRLEGTTANVAKIGFLPQGGVAGMTSKLDISSQSAASNSMAKIDKALDSVSSTRGNLGAIQNRLEVTVNTLTETSSNLADSRSRIEDADFSAESTNLAKAQILSQASTAMLAQANQSQQSVLKLLQ